jgi:hypothetical protein
MCITQCVRRAPSARDRSFGARIGHGGRPKRLRESESLCRSRWVQAAAGLGINANMGIRLSANWGFPVAEAAKLGAQIGVGFNASDAAVHVLDQVEGTSRRTQTFVTAGLFQRPTARFSWGLVYDGLFEHYYDDFQLGQVRGQVGFGMTSDDEVGAWFT